MKGGIAAAMVTSISSIIAAADPPLKPSTIDALRDAALKSSESIDIFTDYVLSHRSGWEEKKSIPNTKPKANPNPNPNLDCEEKTSIGKEKYLWFLNHVSFCNKSVIELVNIGRQQLDRAQTMLEVEKRRNDAAGLPSSLPLARDIEAQINATEA